MKWKKMDKAILKEIDIGETLLVQYNYLESVGFDCAEKITPINSRLKWLRDLYEVK